MGCVGNSRFRAARRMVSLQQRQAAVRGAGRNRPIVPSVSVFPNTSDVSSDPRSLVGSSRADRTLTPLVVLGILFGIVAFLGLLIYEAGFFLGVFIFVVALPAVMASLSYLSREGGTTDDWVFAIPVIGALYERSFAPDTYYKTDAALMFQQAVHNAVTEQVDCLTSTNGLRALSELERKPIMKEFYQRQ